MNKKTRDKIVLYFALIKLKHELAAELSKKGGNYLKIFEVCRKRQSFEIQSVEAQRFNQPRSQAL